MNTKKDVINGKYLDYQRSGKKERGKILDELTASLCPNRDYLATVPQNYGKKSSSETGTTGNANGKRKRKPRSDRGGRPVMDDGDQEPPRSRCAVKSPCELILTGKRPSPEHSLLIRQRIAWNLQKGSFARL